MSCDREHAYTHSHTVGSDYSGTPTCGYPLQDTLPLWCASFREYKLEIIWTGQSKILNSKPKSFFIQACRGDTPGSRPIERVLSDDAGAAVYADVYISYPTISGDKGTRGGRGLSLS